MARITIGRIAAALLAVACLAASPAVKPERGVFALQDGKPAIRSMLTVRGSASGQNKIDIVQYPIGSTVPITHYTLDQTQLMHLVVVRDDFRSFVHLHPVLHDNGHFTVDVALDADHRFYAYADTVPSGDTKQVFRFGLEAGVPPRKLDTTVAASKPTVHAGPYSVRLQSTRIAATQPLRATVTIQRGGRIATDLQPYLGAAAHAVFINTGTLQYVHAHPMYTGAAGTGHMMLMIPALKRGTYKLWLQFRGDSALYAAPFTIVAR
ncbi:MAG: hypothetical protein M3R35_05980 [Candidatus Eremiobacteraeota bacterium]|nr:hypothetical protein [Candidatus Eremiobacteraeota bacterium]